MSEELINYDVEELVETGNKDPESIGYCMDKLYEACAKNEVIMMCNVLYKVEETEDVFKTATRGMKTTHKGRVPPYLKIIRLLLENDELMEMVAELIPILVTKSALRQLDLDEGSETIQ